MLPPSLLGLYCCSFRDAEWTGLGLGCSPRHINTIPDAGALHLEDQALFRYSVGHSTSGIVLGNIMIGNFVLIEDFALRNFVI